MHDQKRHLAAIVFSDIVGFSTLSHRDEALALRLLREHREIVRPFLARYEGREIKTMGDGFLAEFQDAQGAALFAIDVQKAHLDRNQAQPVTDHIRIRMGIHVGDVVPSEGDVYGDGVNIAARLMQLAKPGRVCVSATVLEQARQVIPHWVSTLGPTKLKGISTEVRVFAICVEYGADMPPPLRNRFLLGLRRHRFTLATIGAFACVALALSLVPRSPAIPKGPRRIAVLPLHGIGLGKDYEYLSDGITDELITSLSGLKSIRVLSKPTLSQVRDKSPGEIGKSLRVFGLVDGSVQKLNDTLRINVRLVDTDTQENVWSKEFDENISQTFDVQKKIAHQLFGQFESRSLASISLEAPATPQVPDKLAYQHYLKGKHLLHTRTKDGIEKGLEQLEEAIRIEPNFAPALAAAAHAYLLVNFYGYAPPAEANAKGEKYASEALALDPGNSDALLWFAERSAYETREWKKADDYYRKAIEANPSSVTAYEWYGKFLSYMGRFSDAKAAFAHSLELDPLSHTALSAASSVDYYQGRFPATISASDGAIRIDPSAMLPHFWKAKALVMTADYQGALAEFATVRAASPDSSFIDGFEAFALARSGRRAEVEARLRKLQLEAKQGYVGHYTFARMYMALDRRGDALRELDLSARTNESQAVSLKVDPFFGALRGDPAFERLLKNLGFGS